MPADFSDPSSFRPGGDPYSPGLLISLGPIWLLAPFLERLALEHPDRLKSVRGVIASSSSSAITKRFAFNRFDQELVNRLTTAEGQLSHICLRLNLPCHILRPASTIAWSICGSQSKPLNFADAVVPALALPAHGLRRIHAWLAAVA